MRLSILILALFFSLHSLAEEKLKDSCLQKSVNIFGLYGKHESALLNQWSETAGNLTKITIKSSHSFSKIQFVFKDEIGNILYNKNLSLQKNQSEKFDFQKILKEAVIRPNSFSLILSTSKVKEFCREEITVIEKDGQDGVLKQI